MFALLPKAGSVASTPSNWNFTSPPRPPRKCSWPPCATMPALVATAWLRLSTGISLSFSAVIVCLVAEDLVSIFFSARTSTSCTVVTVLEAPTEKFTIEVWPAFTCTVWITGSKPIAISLTCCVPTGTPGIVKLPFSSVIVPCLVPSTITFAPFVAFIWLFRPSSTRCTT